jgi:transcription initiation factor IIE alpha subunit
MKPFDTIKQQIETILDELKDNYDISITYANMYIVKGKKQYYMYCFGFNNETTLKDCNNIIEQLNKLKIIL